MKILKFIILFLLIATTIGSCKKNSNNKKTVSIPNGDFEQWTSYPTLVNWQTNSCPLCMGSEKQYIVIKDSLAYHGKYAAKFIFNGLYKSRAINKFAIPTPPISLTGYIHSTITSGDTAMISMTIFYKKQVVGRGKLYETSSTSGYKKFEIPITILSSKADSAEIKITGGGKQNTEFVIDYLTLIKK